MELQRFAYDNRLSRMFLNATMFWGFVGMLVGLTIALELVFPLMSSGILAFLWATTPFTY